MLLQNSTEVQVYVQGVMEAKAGQASRFEDYSGPLRLAYQAGYVDGLMRKMELIIKAAWKRAGII